MKVKVIQGSAGFYANLGGVVDFGPVPTQEQARALGALYSGLHTVAVNAAELDQYPTAEDTMDIFNQMMEILTSVS